MSLTGLCLFGATILSYSDDKSTSGKMCFHYSNADLEILRLHQVFATKPAAVPYWIHPFPVLTQKLSSFEPELYLDGKRFGNSL